MRKAKEKKGKGGEVIHFKKRMGRQDEIEGWDV